jgi:hypothetical protein
LKSSFSAAATARKPMSPYSEWPEMAQKITTTLYKWSRDHQPHGDSITSLCRTYGADCSFLGSIINVSPLRGLMRSAYRKHEPDAKR